MLVNLQVEIVDFGMGSRKNVKYKLVKINDKPLFMKVGSLNRYLELFIPFDILTFVNTIVTYSLLKFDVEFQRSFIAIVLEEISAEHKRDVSMGYVFCLPLVWRPQVPIC
jgi:hypothetical protein